MAESGANELVGSLTFETVNANVAQQDQNPTIYNLGIVSANTEVTQTLSTNTKQITIRCRGLARLQIAFNLGQSGTRFLTIPKGCTWNSGEIKFPIAAVHVQSNKASQTVEILEWK